MAVQRADRFPRIVRNSRIQGGEPVVRGTRVPVRAIVVAWREHGDISQLLEAYPRLTEGDIQEVLAFYRANRREIDEQIRAQLAVE